MHGVFDLQSHSIFSDGSLPPAAVVARAAATGVELLALTDHDTVDGVTDALLAARQHAITVVPATELSAVDEVGDDLHVLGYGIDHTNPLLGERLSTWRADRAARLDCMAELLAGVGLEPDRRALDARRARGLPVGRPHLAEVVLADHRERLEREGLTSPSAFIAAYLTPGGAGYSCRSAPLVRDAIAAIHDAGGVAVWAHPFWDLTRAEDVASALVRFVSDGLDGVEAFYITHDRTQTRFLSDLAGKMGLLTTGSADFHCPRHTLFSRFRAFDLFGCTPELGPIAAWS